MPLFVCLGEKVCDTAWVMEAEKGINHGDESDVPMVQIHFMDRKQGPLIPRIPPSLESMYIPLLDLSGAAMTIK